MLIKMQANTLESYMSPAKIEKDLDLQLPPLPEWDGQLETFQEYVLACKRWHLALHQHKRQLIAEWERRKNQSGVIKDAFNLYMRLHELTELGYQNASLIVDECQNGTVWH